MSPPLLVCCVRHIASQCTWIYKVILKYFRVKCELFYLTFTLPQPPKKMCFVNETHKYVDKALIRRDLSLSLSPMVDICNNQRCCILPLITDPWAEEGVDPL